MGVFDGFFQHSIVKVEVAFVHAHIEVLAAKINGIRASLDSRFKCIPRPCRCQKLDGLTR